MEKREKGKAPRTCSHCGKGMHEGYCLGELEYACCDECAIALYDGDEEQFRADLDEEERDCGSTECYWTVWDENCDE